MTHEVAIGFVTAGVVVAVLASIGALVSGTNQFNRLHFVTPITSLAAPLVAVGLGIENGWGLTTGEILLVVGMLFFSAPMMGAATGRLMAERAGKIDSKDTPE